MDSQSKNDLIFYPDATRIRCTDGLFLLICRYWKNYIDGGINRCPLKKWSRNG